MRYFRVVHGAHSEGVDSDGSPKIYGKGKKHGEIVATENDLNKHNSPGVEKKFVELTKEEVERLESKMERLSSSKEESTPAEPASTGLPSGIDSETIAAMKLPALKELAGKMAVDITGLNKQQIQDKLDEIISDE